jgi:hypothetical protein
MHLLARRLPVYLFPIARALVAPQFLVVPAPDRHYMRLKDRHTVVVVVGRRLHCSEAVAAVVGRLSMSGPDLCMVATGRPVLPLLCLVEVVCACVVVPLPILSLRFFLGHAVHYLGRNSSVVCGGLFAKSGKSVSCWIFWFKTRGLLLPFAFRVACDALALGRSFELVVG